LFESNKLEMSEIEECQKTLGEKEEELKSSESACSDVKDIVEI